MTEKCGPFLAILTVLVTIFSAITPARATSDGLIAHWQFDETSGTTAVDSKGGNDGTLVNGPVWQPSGGKIGGALDFDGTDDFVSMDVGTEPVLVDSAGTISAWIRPDSSNVGQDNYWSIFREYYHDNHMNGGGIGFFLYQSGPTDPMTVGARFADISNNYQNIISSSPPILGGQWYHVVVSWNSSTATLFVNGAEVYSNARTVMMGSAMGRNGFDDMNIGSDNGTNGGGLIDDVRIYSRALSAAEVLALYNTKYCAAPVRPESVMFYNACCKTYQFCNGTDWVPIGSAPHCTSDSLISDLVAHWKLDETSGATLYDTAGNHDATVSGLSLPGDSETGVIDNAIHFYHGDHANAGNITELQGAAQATLSAWIRRENVGNSVRVGKNGGSDTDTFTIDLFGSEVSFKIGVSFNQVGFITLDDTNWHHFALVFDGTQTTDSDKLKGYVDGVEQSLTIWGGPLPSSLSSATGDFLIGNSYDHPGSNGHVDDVRIYDRILSAAEVGQIYNGTDMCP